MMMCIYFICQSYFGKETVKRPFALQVKLPLVTYLTT